MAASSLGFFASCSLKAAHQCPVGFTNVFSIRNIMDPGNMKSPWRCIYLSSGMWLFYPKTLEQYRHELQTHTNYNILLEGWSKLCVSHFNYGIYHGLVVIHHNLQATTTPSIMVPTRFRFTCLWMLARERVGGAWLVAGPMTFFHQPDLAGQGRPTLPRQPFLA